MWQLGLPPPPNKIPVSAPSPVSILTAPPFEIPAYVPAGNAPYVNEFHEFKIHHVKHEAAYIDLEGGPLLSVCEQTNKKLKVWNEIYRQNIISAMNRFADEQIIIVIGEYGIAKHGIGANME